MIQIENLSYSFPQKDLYHNISCTIERGNHCAFIGASGSGKSTLIDMIMDDDKHLYDGKIIREENLKIACTSQFYRHEIESKLTVTEYISQEYNALNHSLNEIYAQMATGDNVEELMEKCQEILDKLDAIGGDDFESTVSKKLNLADLGDNRDLLISQISGGEFKLVQLIREMMTIPDLLIMDEPDVFLDFENLNSLRKLINAYKGTLLVITHNRYLLNHCFNKIIHLENMDMQEFEGNFTDYNFFILTEKIRLQELACADSEEIDRNEELIEKLRDIASSNSDKAYGKTLNARVKIQERLEKRRIKEPFVYIKPFDISFISSDIYDEEKTIASVSDYTLAFDDVLLENINFEIKATDKVALIGPNGTGKTTLLRKVFQNEDDSIFVDKDTVVSYLSQIQNETLTEENNIYDEFFEVGFKSYDEIAKYLKDFGFEGEILEQKVSSLSGGEKNTLQLAKVSSCKADFLLLDEPSSHLDINSQIGLEKALKEYTGSILMVSHDFYFIANCMDYVLLIEDKNIRRVSIRKFRKMIYKDHFDKDYLEIDQNKKTLESKITSLLKNKDFAKAKVLAEELALLIK